MDAWEVWDLSGEAGNEVGILSSHDDDSLDTSKHDVYVSGEGIVDSSFTSTHLTNASSKLDTSTSEEPGIVSPRRNHNNYSIGSSRSRNSSCRTDSFSGSEDNIGLTNSYTLDEPGKEKRHVLVLSCSMRMSNSTNSLKTSHDRKNSLIDQCEDDGVSVNRRNSSFNSDFRNDSLNSDHQNNSYNDDGSNIIYIDKQNNISSVNSSPSTGNKGALNLTGSFEDSNGLSRSYTLQEEGMEKRHVYVMSGKQKSSSSSTLNTLSNRSNSFDGQDKYKTDKELSRSTSAINKVYDNANNNRSNGLMTSPTFEKKNTSIFTKAKHFFNKSTSLTKLDRSIENRSRNNSTSTDDGVGLTDNFKITTSQGEEKHVLIVSRSGSLNSPKLVGKLNSFDLSQGNISSKEFSDSSGCNTPEKQSRFLSERKTKAHSRDANKEDGGGMTDSNTSDYSDIEEEYDIINIVNPRKVDPDSKTTEGEDTERCIPKDTKYDIVFQPEKIVTESNVNDEVSPLQKGLMSLVVGVGLGDEEETKNVVTNIVHPHSVVEHGNFKLNGYPNDDSNEDGNESDGIPKTSDLTGQNIIPVLAMNGLLLGTPAINTNILTDKLQENSIKSGSNIGESERNDIDNNYVLPDLYVRYPMTSTPIKTNVKYTEKKLVTNGNSTPDNRSKTVEVLHTTAYCSPDEITNRNNHVRILKFDEDSSLDEAYQNEHRSLKEQYGIHEMSKDVSNCSLSSNEGSLSSDQNTTSEGYEEDYELESDQIATMSDDSIDTISMNKHLLFNHMSKLENYDKVIDPSDVCPKRKVSTDSLASFEYHERELTNQSLVGSPVVSPGYPLSPNYSSMRCSPRTVYPYLGYLPTSSLNGFSSGPDSLDEDEGINDLTNEILAERRMTTELLNYMPAIEEGSESFSLECDEQKWDSTPSIPTECNHVRKESSEKGTLDRSVNAKQDHGNESLDEQSDEHLNIDMGADVSKIDGKKKVKRSSRKGSKSKKKKGKTPLADAHDEEQITRSSEKVWIYDTKSNEDIETDKNGNFLQETEKKKVKPDSDVVHCYNEDPDFAIREAVHKKKYKVKSKQDNSYIDASKNNATDKIGPSSDPYVDADKANVIDNVKPSEYIDASTDDLKHLRSTLQTTRDHESTNQLRANEYSNINVLDVSDKTPKENEITKADDGNFVFEIPIDRDHVSVISLKSNPTKINSLKIDSHSNRSVIPKNDGDEPESKPEVYESVDGNCVSESEPNIRPSTRTGVQARDAEGFKTINEGISNKNETDMPKKCLWYDYSKDSTSGEKKTLPNIIIEKECAINSNEMEGNILSIKLNGTNSLSKSTENVALRIVFMEDEKKGKPVVRSNSFGPSSTRSKYMNTSTDNTSDDTPVGKETSENVPEGKSNPTLSNDNSDDTILLESKHETSSSSADLTNSTSIENCETTDAEFLTVPKLIVTQASVESTDGDSGVEQVENFHIQNEGTDVISKTDVISLEDEEDEEERDSGTELRYDDFLSNEPTNNRSDYEKWLENIKPLLHDAELVANLYLRLANKYGKCFDNKKEETIYTQYLHSAQIAYDVIKESNLTNFASVITYLLSYMGAIKSEKELPENICVPNLLTFLEELIKRNTMTSEHVTMFTCFLSRPNKKLTAYHELRLSFLHTSFKQEISQLNVNTEELIYLRVCFMKISEYFIQLDMDIANEVTKECILPYVTDLNSTMFVMTALTYMGLVKSEEPMIITNDVTSALILLDIIFRSRKMSLLTSQKLYAFIQLNNPRFRFCSTEREDLTETLKRAIDF